MSRRILMPRIERVGGQSRHASPSEQIRPESATSMSIAQQANASTSAQHKLLRYIGRLLTLAAGLALAFAVSGAEAATVPGGIGIVATGNAQVTVCSSVSGGLAADGSTRAPALVFSGGGNTLTLEAGFQFTGAVSSAGNDTLALGGDTLTHCNQPGDGTLTVDSAFHQQFTGFSHYAKTGTSYWTVTGTGSSMDWQVQAGTLELDGSFGAATVASDATLAGNGTLAGVVTLAADATLSPGARGIASGVGTLHAASLDWQAGADTAFQLGASAAQSDHIALAGALQTSGSGTFHFHFDDGNTLPQPGTSYPLIGFASAQGVSAADFSYSYVGQIGGVSGHFELTAGELSFVVDALVHQVGGTVTGLAGSGLQLALNGSAQSLPIAADGSFSFPTALNEGTSYAVSVATQPSAPNQVCVVLNGSGSVPGHDVTNIVVNCGPVSSYTVGGSVSGLTGGSVTLTLNGGNATTLASNGGYTFPAQFAPGASYVAAIAAQPAGQQCTLANATGVVGAGNVSNVNVSCQNVELHTDVTLLDDGDYAPYGQLRTYFVRVRNLGSQPAQGVTVSGSFSSAFDVANVHWQCFNGNPAASCTPQGGAGFADTATIPANASMLWLVSAPVSAGSPAATATFTVNVDGGSPASDSNTLVILRDGFDQAYPGGGLPPTTPALDLTSTGDSDSIVVRVPAVPAPGIHTLRVLRVATGRAQVQLATVWGRSFARLMAHAAGITPSASAWRPVEPGSTLVLGSLRAAPGQQLLLLEGENISLQLTVPLP